ncbi:MAG: nickel-dependent lactate racemase [Shewanella psychromarinicola]|jgi:nickel-dependent lactate racemase|uniref:Nickel-dependent lactate racemase n=1 Tax=Shewanella psychromarinicola TaxID=2487742 RepID=A0A3N4E0W0_9GAMM|nr:MULTISPECIES: nickel-dependent lactate racemase [Shewanella]AZG36128.1 nickel-dependent lactate racemase [Shewanella psychromarinicola]MCL1080502.1 nickel-dependent lactate racemase [Shewanella psychromarinicola]PKG77428.1 lactate racemization operon protein LarA [Shewanella sp. Actino-trap-3]RPA31819.1 nickel-dependent lactate racemase [Shewanella psychromarinicola]|tara:strand:+ start:208077 stop:209354 length:1278 start_codon:yes stop_codon:yes gene_type:complete
MFQKIKMPYAKKTVEISIEKKYLQAVLIPQTDEFDPKMTQEEIVLKSLENPIGTKKLSELAVGKNKIVFVTSDHTRPLPSRVTVPLILKEIRKGNPDAEITILIATGFHRPTTREELIYKMGEEVVDNEIICNHISTNDEDQVFMGTLPSGGDLYLNKLAMEADLLIAEGFIEAHFFAGFSGGRKSILPGIASAKTIMYNHNSEFISNPKSRTGNLEDNPIHKDMIYAAKQSKCAFILNTVINGEKDIIGCFTGDISEAHLVGCKFVDDLAAVKKNIADIGVTTNGGYPLDQNIYQTVKGLTAAEATTREGGVLIALSSCVDGHGGEGFYNSVASAKNANEILEKVANIKKEDTLPDQWEFQILARLLSKYTVIIVTDECDPKIITDMHMEHAFTFDEALEKARSIVGKEATITVVPDGVATIVK